MTRDEWFNRLTQLRLNLDDAGKRRADARQKLADAEQESTAANDAWRSARSRFDEVVLAEVEL